MKRLVSLAAIISSLGLTGCASVSVVYPEYRQPPTVSVSSDTVSTATETPAEDFLIPDSQVFIAGKGGASRYLALLGVAIDRSRNETAISQTSGAFKQKFNAQLSGALKHVSAKTMPPNGAVKLVETGGDVLMLPAARLVIQDDAKGDLSFRVTVRFKELATGNEGRKNYWHVYGIRPIEGPGGWAENNAAAFKEASNQVMARMAEVILEDMSGGFRNAVDPGKQRLIRYKSLTGEQVATSVLLKEQPDYFVVVPTFRGKPMQGIVLIVPKDIVRLQP